MSDLLDIWNFDAFVLRGMAYEDQYSGSIWRLADVEVRIIGVVIDGHWPLTYPVIYHGSAKGALAVIGIYAWWRVHHG